MFVAGDYMIQSHVQFSQRFDAPQTGRNGAAEKIFKDPPDATARSSSGASVMYCNDTCVLGMRGVLESHCGGLGC